MEEKKLFAIFPYIKTSEVIRIRGINYYPSQNLKENEDICEDCKKHLSALFKIFYKNHNKQIEQMAFSHFHIDSNEEYTSKILRIQEAKILIGYFYSTPHFPVGDPFLLYEHSNLFLFEPGKVSKHIAGLLDQEETYEHKENDISSTLVDGYEGTLNFNSYIQATHKSKIYPHVPNFWLNLSQDLYVDLKILSSRQYNWPLIHIFRTDEGLHQETKDRIFTALDWYNRSCSSHLRENVSIVHLATAFESLLDLEQGSDLTKRFKDTVLTLLGKTPLLESWLEQFYTARSKILHEGYWPHLMFYPTDKDSYKKILKGKKEGASYRKLSSYGRRVFRLCLNTILSGAITVKETKLHSLFADNQKRLESICKKLNRGDINANEKLRSISHDVRDLHDYWLESAEVTKIATIIAAGKLLIKTFLNTNPSLPVEIETKLKIIIDENQQYNEYEILELFDEVKSKLSERKVGYKTHESVSTSIHTDILNLFLEYASMPSFILKSEGVDL